MLHIACTRSHMAHRANDFMRRASQIMSRTVRIGDFDWKTRKDKQGSRTSLLVFFLPFETSVRLLFVWHGQALSVLHPDTVRICYRLTRSATTLVFKVFPSAENFRLLLAPVCETREKSGAKTEKVAKTLANFRPIRYNRREVSSLFAK